MVHFYFPEDSLSQSTSKWQSSHTRLYHQLLMDCKNQVSLYCPSNLHRQESVTSFFHHFQSQPQDILQTA